MDTETSETSRPGEQQPSLTRRLAAGGALLALFAAVAVVALGVFRNPLMLVLALAALAIAVVAAWTSLVHRGAHRVIAAVVAAAALLGTVLLLDLNSILRIVLVIALVLVSVAAGR